MRHPVVCCACTMIWNWPANSLLIFAWTHYR